MKKKISILAAVFVLVAAVFLLKAYAAQTKQMPLAGNLIPQFAQPLPLLSLAPSGDMREMTAYVAPTSEFEIHMREFRANILPPGFTPPLGWHDNVPGTWVWGYILHSATPTTNLETYIGPVIVATRGTPSKIKFYNDLGNVRDSKVLAWKYSTDQTLHWADPAHSEANPYLDPPEGSTFHRYGTAGSLNYGEYIDAQGDHLFSDVPIPAVVHLHGGEVPPMLDGGPDSWVMSFNNPGYAMSGHGYYTYLPPPTGFTQGDPAPGNYFQYNYPNTQEAANIWFHDHVLGVTRLNVYAGMAGAYVLVDSAHAPPDDLKDPTKIVPVVIQDRMFDTNGQLFFPADSAGGVLWATNPEHPYWVPEFLGDVIVVNGKAWPYLDVKPARYRLLFINGSNARTYEMWVSNPITGARAPWWVIGTDGGYLDKPVKINKLTMMPGERYDVIVDFTGLSTGTPANDYFILLNNARTPFPKGVPPNGATVGQIMQFRVNPGATTADLTFNPALGGNLRPTNPVVRLPGTPGGPNVKFTRPAALDDNVQVKRQLTLNEVMGLPQVVEDPVVEDLNNPGFGLLTAYPGGPLEVVLNNTKWSGNNPLGVQANPGFTLYPDAGSYGPVYYSELPTEGTTEQWEIINITADAHPIHLHLVQFQVMNRQNFDFNKFMNAYAAGFVGGVVKEAYGPPFDYSTENTDNALGGNPPISPYLKGKAVPPAAEEQGWKDTVISYPGQVLRLSVRWAPTDLPNTTLPAAAYFPFNPNHGHGYVWHCHIIDHEDNEMMRPTSVIPNTNAPDPRPYTNY